MAYTWSDTTTWDDSLNWAFTGASSVTLSSQFTKLVNAGKLQLAQVDLGFYVAENYLDSDYYTQSGVVCTVSVSALRVKLVTAAIASAFTQNTINSRGRGFTSTPPSVFDIAATVGIIKSADANISSSSTLTALGGFLKLAQVDLNFYVNENYIDNDYFTQPGVVCILSVSTQRIKTTTVAITGAFSPSITANIIVTRGITMLTVSTLSATPNRLADANVTLATIVALSLQAARSRTSAVSLATAFSSSANGVVTTSCNATISSQSSLTATISHIEGADLVAFATASLNITAIRIRPGASAMTSASTIATSAGAIRSLTETYPYTWADLTTWDGVPADRWTFTGVLLPSQFTFTAVAVKAKTATVSLDTAFTSTTNANRLRNISTSQSSAFAIVANDNVIRNPGARSFLKAFTLFGASGTIKTATAAITTVSTVSATANRLRGITSTPPSAFALAATGLRIKPLASAIASASSLTALGGFVKTATTIPTWADQTSWNNWSYGTWTSTSIASAFTLTGDLTEAFIEGSADLSSAFTLTASALDLDIAVASLSSASTLSASANRLRGTAVELNVSTAIITDANRLVGFNANIASAFAQNTINSRGRGFTSTPPSEFAISTTVAKTTNTGVSVTSATSVSTGANRLRESAVALASAFSQTASANRLVGVSATFSSAVSISATGNRLRGIVSTPPSAFALTAGAIKTASAASALATVAAVYANGGKPFFGASAMSSVSTMSASGRDYVTNDGFHVFYGVGTPTIQSSVKQFTEAIYFNGSSYIYSADSADWNQGYPYTGGASTGFTLDLWINLSSVSSSAYVPIIGTNSITGTATTGWALGAQDNGASAFTMRFTPGGGSSEINIVSSPFSYGTGYHIRIIKEDFVNPPSGANSGYYVYANGTRIVNGSLGRARGSSTNNQFFVGGNPNSSSGSQFITGYVDSIHWRPTFSDPNLGNASITVPTSEPQFADTGTKSILNFNGTYLDQGNAVLEIGSAIVSGPFTLVANASRIRTVVSDPISLSSAFAISATVLDLDIATVALSTAVTFTATANRLRGSSVTLASASAVSTAPIKTASATANTTTVASISAGVVTTVSAVASMASAFTQTTVNSRGRGFTSTPPSAFVITITANKIASGAGTIASAISQTVNANRLRSSSVTIATAVTTSITAVKTVGAVASMASAVSVSALVNRLRDHAVVLASAFTQNTINSRGRGFTSTPPSEFVVVANVGVIKPALASITSNASLTALGGQLKSVVVDLSFYVDSDYVVDDYYESKGSRALLTVTATRLRGIVATPPSAFTVSATANVVRKAVASINSSASLTVVAIATRNTGMNCNARFTLVAREAKTQNANAVFSTSASITAQLSKIQRTSAALTSAFTIAVTGIETDEQGVAALSSAFTISVSVKRFRGITAPLASASTLICVGTAISVFTIDPNLTYTIPSETRLHNIYEETRVYDIAEETRIFTIPSETRQYGIGEETREYTIKG